MNVFKKFNRGFKNFINRLRVNMEEVDAIAQRIADDMAEDLTKTVSKNPVGKKILNSEEARLAYYRVMRKFIEMWFAEAIALNIKYQLHRMKKKALKEKDREVLKEELIQQIEDVYRDEIYKRVKEKYLDNPEKLQEEIKKETEYVNKIKERLSAQGMSDKEIEKEIKRYLRKKFRKG